MNAAAATAGGGLKMRLRLQYYCVLAAAVAAAVVVFLTFVSPAAVAPLRYTAGRGAGAAGGGGGGEVGGGGGGPVIFNFGDSNSDTGGVAAAMGVRIAPPEGRAFFRRPTGRLSDGRVMLDFICESLNTHHLTPYLKAVGADFSNGANFAIAGSSATHGFSPFSLNVQVDQFLYFKHTSLDLIDQGLRGPVDEEGFRNAVYMIDIGQNDVGGLLYSPLEKVLQKIPTVVAEIRAAIQTLYQNGARKFWVHGTGALGCLPAMLWRDHSDIDGNGCLRKANRGAMAFNAQLSEMCGLVGSQLQDATVVYTDLFAIKYDLVANHTKHGIEKPLMACCGYGGPPYNYDPAGSCTTPGGQLCAPDAKLISWDGVHLTDYANGVAAAMILTGDYSTPRIKLASLVMTSAKSADS